MIPVQAPNSVALKPVSPRARSAAPGFAQCLHAPHGDAPVTAVSPASECLLLMQAEHEGEEAPRRRRPPREAALAALNLLQGLQKTLLAAGDNAGTQDLLAAAEEVESIGASADPALARLCAALSTRLRVELAKRGVEDGPGP